MDKLDAVESKGGAPGIHLQAILQAFQNRKEKKVVDIQLEDTPEDLKDEENLNSPKKTFSERWEQVSPSVKKTLQRYSPRRLRNWFTEGPAPEENDAVMEVTSAPTPAQHQMVAERQSRYRRIAEFCLRDSPPSPPPSLGQPHSLFSHSQPLTDSATPLSLASSSPSAVLLSPEPEQVPLRREDPFIYPEPLLSPSLSDNNSLELLTPQSPPKIKKPLKFSPSDSVLTSQAVIIKTNLTSCPLPYFDGSEICQSTTHSLHLSSHGQSNPQFAIAVTSSQENQYLSCLPTTSNINITNLDQPLSLQRDISSSQSYLKKSDSPHLHGSCPTPGPLIATNIGDQALSSTVTISYEKHKALTEDISKDKQVKDICDFQKHAKCFEAALSEGLKIKKRVSDNSISGEINNSGRKAVSKVIETKEVNKTELNHFRKIAELNDLAEIPHVSFAQTDARPQNHEVENKLRQISVEENKFQTDCDNSVEVRSMISRQFVDKFPKPIIDQVAVSSATSNATNRKFSDNGCMSETLLKFQVTETDFPIDLSKLSDSSGILGDENNDQENNIANLKKIVSDQVQECPLCDKIDNLFCDVKDLAYNTPESLIVHSNEIGLVDNIDLVAVNEITSKKQESKECFKNKIIEKLVTPIPKLDIVKKPLVVSQEKENIELNVLTTCIEELGCAKSNRESIDPHLSGHSSNTILLATSDINATKEVIISEKLHIRKDSETLFRSTDANLKVSELPENIDSEFQEDSLISQFTTIHSSDDNAKIGSSQASIEEKACDADSITSDISREFFAKKEAEMPVGPPHIVVSEGCPVRPFTLYPPPPDPNGSLKRKSPVTVQEWVDHLPAEPTPVPEIRTEEPLLECAALLRCQASARLSREPSVQSSSSLDSLLDSRRPDPVEVLLNLGFGGVPGLDLDNCRIPKRFLVPSKCKGGDWDEFLRRELLQVQNFECSALGFRGLSGSNHQRPSAIVANIMEKLRERSTPRPPPRVTNRFTAVAKRVLSETSVLSKLTTHNSSTSVLNPDNRKFLESQGKISPEVPRRRIIFGEKSFAITKDGELVEDEPMPSKSAPVAPSVGSWSVGSGMSNDVDTDSEDGKLDLEVIAPSPADILRMRRSSLQRQRRVEGEDSLDDGPAVPHRFDAVTEDGEDLRDALAAEIETLSRRIQSAAPDELAALLRPMKELRGKLADL